MICKTCGKEFETEDKRIKNCDNCRNKKVKINESEADEFIKRLKDRTDDLRKHLDKMKRRAFIRMITHYVVHILEISAILALFVVK